MKPPASFPLTPVKRFRASGGFYVPARSLAFTFASPDPLPAHVRLLKSALPLRVTSARFTASDAFVCTLGSAPEPPEPASRPEAYSLSIAETGVVLRAVSAEGLFRGCATLAAILSSRDPIPCGVIEDEPEKRVRGVMLDVSRNRVWSLETLFEIADWMARLRLNRLELYFEAVFAYRAHPTVWSGTSPYTPADLTALSAYCRERFITLVPNQNTLGHFERWFLADPAYLRYAELPQGGARTPWGSIQTTPTGLCTGDEAAGRFVEGLLDELLPCFPDAVSANLGCDEVFDLAQGRSAGKGEKADLFFAHLRRVADCALRHGKRPEFWADMLLRHPEFLPQAGTRLPEARWILWGYEASDPLAAHAVKLREAGLDFLVSPGSSSWRSFCGRTANMLANLRAAAAIACDGLLLTDWGDAGHWQPLAVTVPSLVHAARLAWCADASETELPQAVDALTGIAGLGDLLLTLGDTCRMAEAESGNGTQLFKAYNLPLNRGPDCNREALEKTREFLLHLADRAAVLGESLLARETRFALGLQQLAVDRALGLPGLGRQRARLAARLQILWRARGPEARLAASLADFLAPDLP